MLPRKRERRRELTVALCPTRDREEELSKQIHLREINKSVRIHNIYLNLPK